MLDLRLSILTEEDAKILCTWRYEDPYSVYNFSDWETVRQNHWDLAVKEKREAEFLAVKQGNRLAAYGRIYPSQGKVFIGLGLEPSLCGKGYGKQVVRVMMEESKRRHPGKVIALEVRSFNQRALKCYVNVGFQVKDRYVKDTLLGSDTFYYMEYENAEREMRETNGTGNQ